MLRRPSTGGREGSITPPSSIHVRLPSPCFQTVRSRFISPTNATWRIPFATPLASSEPPFIWSLKDARRTRRRGNGGTGRNGDEGIGGNAGVGREKNRDGNGARRSDRPT